MIPILIINKKKRARGILLPISSELSTNENTRPQNPPINRTMPGDGLNFIYQVLGFSGLHFLVPAPDLAIFLAPMLDPDP